MLVQGFKASRKSRLVHQREEGELHGTAMKCAQHAFKPVNFFKADDPSYVIPYPILNGTRDGLYTSRLGLSFKVSPRHFGNNADMKLKCTASIGSTYLRSNEKSAEGVKHKRDSSGMLSRRQQQHLQDSGERADS